MDGTGTSEDQIDILIVGAGISGIDAAWHLKHRRSGTSFAIVEAKDQLGGTWAQHRFPGIRSDSDLFTFGFSWKPWMGVPIATAEEILSYLDEAVAEQDLSETIRFNTKVLSADWSSARQGWRVVLETPEGPSTLSCKFLWMCAGYYRHEAGFLPDWPGMDAFDGPIIHPQNWPEGLDYAGKDVIVIGSGATAATLIPAMAAEAGMVTMVQRSPTWFLPRPQTDEFRETMAKLDLPDETYHAVMRQYALHNSEMIARRAREDPDGLAEELLGYVRAYLGPDFDIDTHFRPRYRPWRQRIAIVPDGDLFRAIARGDAGVVTGQIDRFVAEGLRMQDGQIVRGDIIVAATGLTLCNFGQVDLAVDGVAFDPADSVTHRGLMFTGLPNFASVFGYLRSSWTLRADLVADYLCRLFEHMEAEGQAVVRPVLRPEDADMAIRPWIVEEDFNPGYITRALDILPKQGDRQPWVMTQDYYLDVEDLPAARFDDGTLVYEAERVAVGVSQS